MTKQRASIRGRGAEILFGEPTPVGRKPRSSELAGFKAASVSQQAPDTELPAQAPDTGGSSPVPSEEPETSGDEQELERALEEEAQAGAPSQEEDVQEPPAPKASPRPMPREMRMQPAAALAAGKTPEEPEREAVMYEPPPPQVSDLVGGVLPPKPERLYLAPGEEELEGLDIQEPEDKVKPIELPDRELTEEEKAQILAWLGDQRLQKLESAIDEAYEDVRLKVAENEDVATDCYNKLLRARDTVVRRDAARIAQAEYYLELVRARLKRVVESDAAAQKYQWRILVWGLFWFAGLLTLLIMLNDNWFRQFILPPSLDNTLIDMDVFLSTMIWGGIGAVVAVLYSLFKHVGRRDFDAHYNLSYIGKPFLGVILGATVYMVFNLLIRSLGILPIGLEGAGQVSTPTIAPGLMYLMAWASGFKENRIFDLVDRRFFSGGQATEPALSPGSNTPAG
jgi:hypothetical protein